MDRILKLLPIVIILSALTSCGIFFTPMDDRWNPADPKNELLTFNPSLDGYIEGGATWNDSSDLYVYPGSKITLIRFDTADFPRVVAASYLQLSATSELSPGPVLEIFRITNDWDPSRILYYDVTPGDFYDDSVVAAFPITGYVSDIEIPLGEVFRGNRDDLANGIVIFSSQNVTFHSSETGLSGTSPFLLVEPE
jgi:hypothetical protein